jgi:hypothetical protein
MRGADATMHKLTHIKTEWSASEDDAVSPAATQISPNSGLALHNLTVARTRSLGEISKKGIVLGRSLYYGILLYLGAITGGFWLTITLQALALLFALYLSLRTLGLPVWPAIAYLGFGLCFLSDAPFFTSYLMPDLFAGIAILACASLIAARRQLANRDYAMWFLLLTLAMLFHDSCTLISVVLLGIALIANLLRRSWLNWRALCIIPLAAAAAYVGQAVVAYGVQRTTGQPPLRLPFISARLIADGPGTNYLRATCPASGFTLCDYINRFPMPSEQFLYGPTPPQSLFEVASYSQRKAISAEQFRFLLAVLKYDPLGVFEATARNSGKQLSDFRLAEFNYNRGLDAGFDRSLPLRTLAQVRGTAAYRGVMPVNDLTAILYVLVAISLFYLLFALFSRRRRGFREVSCWILAGVVVNAVVCGAISNQLPRYEARVVWLLPLLVLMIEFSSYDWWRRRFRLRVS